MESVLLFVFGCMLCLMFLGMLYGERLSMIGMFDGEWLRPVGEVLSRSWDGLCEAVDVTIEFILDHLSWVVAAVSGTAGLLLVVFILGGGLASDAAAYHRDKVTPLRAGSVVDKVEVVSARSAQSPIILASEQDHSDLISQAKTANYLVFGRPEYAPIRPRPRRPIDGSIDLPRSISERPLLGVTFRRLGDTVIRSDLNPDVLTRGQLAESLPNPFFVDRIVRRLERDNWRESLGLPRDESGLPRDALPESPLAAVRDLESRVRVTPGVDVSARDLRVEKTVPRESPSGDITIQVSLTNLGDKTIAGLIVRELLPLDTQVRGANPNAVLRNDTLTWLVDNLRPAEEYVLRFTVIPANQFVAGGLRSAVFESLTEVSAVTAVASRTTVAEKRPVEDPFREIRRRETSPPPEIAGSPDLRLVIDEPTEPAKVGEWTRILFTLSNQGTADATAVKLRLTLDSALDHSDLLERPSTERQVFVDVDRVSMGQVRRFRLEVRPKSRGESLSTAEVVLGGSRVERQTFRLVALESTQPRRPPESVIR